MPSHASSNSDSRFPAWLPIVQEKVESLRFGVVQVVVHDGKVTQIERTDKTRLDTPVQDPALRRRENY